jgi:hypothetical protein
MSDPSMDDLIALYRAAAREKPLPETDARLLQLAARQSRYRHRLHYWAWPAAALAASVLLWLTTRVAPEPVPPHVPTSTSTAVPGRMDGRDRAYLMSMNVAPPLSPATQFLLGQNAPSP